MYLLAWIDTVEEWLSPFRAWFAENSKSPLFWFAYFLLGVLIFTITYRSLNKDR